MVNRAKVFGIFIFFMVYPVYAALTLNAFVNKTEVPLGHSIILEIEANENINKDIDFKVLESDFF